MEDSRVKGLKTTHPHLPLERTYCANCGRPYGWVSTDTYEFIRVNNILAICPLCEETLGEVPLIRADILEQ